MARATINRGLDSQKAQQVISMAVGTAEALVTGVGRMAERVIAETARAAEDVGTAIAAPQIVAKARGRRRRRRGIA